MTELTEEQKQRNRLWVEALRSGKYRQCRAALRKTNDQAAVSYCCLGVACEVFRIQTGKGSWLDEGYEGRFTASLLGMAGRSSTTYPPNAVCAWFGWPLNNPRLLDVLAANRNDDNGESFKQIAEAAEKEFGLTESVEGGAS